MLWFKAISFDNPVVSECEKTGGDAMVLAFYKCQEFLQRFKDVQALSPELLKKRCNWNSQKSKKHGPFLAAKLGVGWQESCKKVERKLQESCKKVERKLQESCKKVETFDASNPSPACSLLREREEREYIEQTETISLPTLSLPAERDSASVSFGDFVNQNATQAQQEEMGYAKPLAPTEPSEWELDCQQMLVDAAMTHPGVVESAAWVPAYVKGKAKTMPHNAHPLAIDAMKSIWLEAVTACVKPEKPYPPAAYLRKAFENKLQSWKPPENWKPQAQQPKAEFKDWDEVIAAVDDGKLVKVLFWNDWYILEAGVTILKKRGGNCYDLLGTIDGKLCDLGMDDTALRLGLKTARIVDKKE